MVTRWDEWFSASNLAKDKRILSAPPSQSAERAAQAFLARGKGVILDLACGVGRDTFYLEGRGLAVVGVDASSNGLRAARGIRAERDAVSELINADAKDLPFGDHSFEGVYCFGLLHEFVGEERVRDLRDLMREVSRVLDDDGILIVTVLAGEPGAGLPAVQLFTREMFERVAEGFEAVEVEKYDDTGCTGRHDYSVWYGKFHKAA